MKETLHGQDRFVAALADGGEQGLAIRCVQRQRGRIEMVDNAVIDDVAGGVEVLTGANVNRAQRGDQHVDPFGTRRHGCCSRLSGTTGA